MQFRDYYKTLGLTKTATEEEIKKAFRKLARLYHPDVAKDKKGAENKFKEINEAYEVLGDSAKRRQYDELGSDWDTPGGYGSAGSATSPRSGRGVRSAREGATSYNFDGTGFSDFFEAFFSQASGYRAGRPAQAEEESRGYDTESDLLITFEEALRGGTRALTLRRTDALTGQVSSDSLQVKIPAGVREGQRIRLQGQGHPGSGSTTAGDLYLRINYAKHPDFRADGPDLLCELEVAPWEAVLGGSVTMPTLEGSVALKIQPSSQNGQKLRLRGLGLPKGKGERGDLYAVLQLQLPTTITPAERTLWEQLAHQAKT
jgi:curved DNA-binding protein